LVVRYNTREDFGDAPEFDCWNHWFTKKELGVEI